MVLFEAAVQLKEMLRGVYIPPEYQEAYNRIPEPEEKKVIVLRAYDPKLVEWAELPRKKNNPQHYQLSYKGHIVGAVSEDGEFAWQADVPAPLAEKIAQTVNMEFQVHANAEAKKKAQYATERAKAFAIA